MKEGRCRGGVNPRPYAKMCFVKKICKKNKKRVDKLRNIGYNIFCLNDNRLQNTPKVSNAGVAQR